MKKKTVKLTKKAEVLLKHMEIHSIKDIVFAAQYDPLSGILILTDAIDPVLGSEKTYQAGWEAGYQVGNERGFSTGYHEALSNATEGFLGPFS